MAMESRDYGLKYFSKLVFDAKLTLCLWHLELSIETKFCKKYFRNDCVITKITKIFYYENLELYGSHFSNYHDIHTIYIIRATQYVLKSDVLTVYHTAQG